MTFPEWQLHRGYWKSGVRENTMEAFKKAKEVGCEMIELDVQMSRDRILHTFHDYSLKKFFKIDKQIKQINSQDLLALNIPKLADVIESDDVPYYINVEVKTIDLWCRPIMERVCRLLRDFSGKKNVLVSSFNPMCLFWASYATPEIPRALIVGEKKVFNNWKFALSMKLARPQYLNVHYSLVDDSEVHEKLLSLNRPLMVWTVNNAKKALNYLQNTESVVSVISDLPTVKKI